MNYVALKDRRFPRGGNPRNRILATEDRREKTKRRCPQDNSFTEKNKNFDCAKGKLLQTKRNKGVPDSSAQRKSGCVKKSTWNLDGSAAGVGSRRLESFCRKMGVANWMFFSQIHSSRSWKLKSNFQKTAFGIQLMEDRTWIQTSRSWKFEVRRGKESRDHLSQYFFRAKTCVKTRKNGSFRGGKPPG